MEVVEIKPETLCKKAKVSVLNTAYGWESAVVNEADE